MTPTRRWKLARTVPPIWYILPGGVALAVFTYLLFVLTFVI